MDALYTQLHSAMKASPYTPLDPKLKEIRVIQLAPGSYDDDLRIRLRVKSLEGARPIFNALSYAWGREICPKQVLVNGVNVSIGRNLDSALRTLRPNLIGKLLWVDALCINQKDLKERSQQVQIMGEIYSAAEEVMVWLSAEHRTDQFVVDSIEHKRIPKSASEAVSLSRALRRVCLRPWFSRIWVAQEIALARESPILYLGRSNVRLNRFYDYLDILHYYQGVKNSRQGWPIGSQVAFLVACVRAQRLWQLREISALPIIRFSMVLSFAKELKATDPRDKVYAILSLCTTYVPPNAIVPDYSKSPGQVFLEASKYLISDQQVFPYERFPLHPPLGMRPISSTGLPSWAFDLTIGSESDLNHTMHHPSHFISSSFKRLKFEYKRNFPVCSRFPRDLQQLHTIGLHIGTVADSSMDLLYASRSPNPDPDSDLLSEAALRKVYHDLLSPRHIPASALKSALTFKRGELSGYDVIDMDICERFLKEGVNIDATATSELEKKKWDIYSELGTHEDVLLFVTEEGGVGTLYHPQPLTAVQPGDVVVGLFGINFPFVLRPNPRRKGAKQTYTMINIAHVVDHKYGHNFLNNAGPGAKWEDYEEFGLREYIIV